MEVFLSQYVDVRSGNFLVITPLKEDFEQQQSRTANRPHPDLIKKRRAQNANFAFSDRS